MIHMILDYPFCNTFFSQDEGLDVIAEGLDTLKHMASDMNEVCCIWVLYFGRRFLSTAHEFWIEMLLILQELDRQVPLMDEIDTKV